MKYTINYDTIEEFITEYMNGDNPQQFQIYGKYDLENGCEEFWAYFWAYFNQFIQPVLESANVSVIGMGNESFNTTIISTQTSLLSLTESSFDLPKDNDPYIRNFYCPVLYEWVRIFNEHLHPKQLKLCVTMLIDDSEDGKLLILDMHVLPLTYPYQHHPLQIHNKEK